MNRNLVDSVLPVSTSGTFNGVFWKRSLSDFTTTDERNVLFIGCKFEVEQKVGPDTIAPFDPNAIALRRLVFENDTGHVDRVGVKFRARRDGVISWLETRDRRNDNIERNGPRSGVFG